MERSLILIKPDGTQRNLTGVILARFEGAGLKLVGLKMLQMDKRLATKHYAVHIEKPFFTGLVDYISSGPIVAAVFEGDNAVSIIRGVTGATDPKKAAPGTIRAEFGLNIEHNTIHASDSPETARDEIALFFSGSELFEFRKA